MTLVPDNIGPFTSLQAVFNRAWEWSRTHGPGMSDLGHCELRTARGNACLIGACIPDSLYARELEADFLSSWDSNRPVYDKIFPYLQTVEDADVLSDLQGCHDSAALRPLGEDDYLKSVTDNLRDFASKHHLTIPS